MSVLGVVAVLAELAVGVFYLVLIAVGPDDPALDWLLTAIKLLFAAVYVATVVGLVWAWTRWSWLVIAAPIAAWIVFRVGYAIASGFVPEPPSDRALSRRPVQSRGQRGGRMVARRRATGGVRKVRAPQRRVAGNARPPRDEDQCHSDDAALRPE